VYTTTNEQNDDSLPDIFFNFTQLSKKNFTHKNVRSRPTKKYFYINTSLSDGREVQVLLDQNSLDLDDKPGREMKNQDTLFGFLDLYIL